MTNRGEHLNMLCHAMSAAENCPWYHNSRMTDCAHAGSCSKGFCFPLHASSRFSKLPNVQGTANDIMKMTHKPLMLQLRA